MNYNHAVVQLSRISLNDQYFRISNSTDLELLSRSMADCGLINAPIVAEGSDSLTIVSGFGRCAAAQRLGWTDLPVRIIPAPISTQSCIHIAIADNTSQRALNLTEQVRSIALLQKDSADIHELIRRARLCGLAVNSKVISALLKIVQLPSTLEPGLSSGSIAMPVATRLAEMDDQQAAEKLGLLLMELDVSLNRQRETVDWIEAIGRLEKLQIKQILENEQLVSLLNETQTERRQKSQLVRQYLKSRRYPAISTAEKEFELQLRRLRLPEKMQIIAPPGFESSVYSIQLRVADLEELKDLQKELRRIAESPILRSFFEREDW